MGALPKSEFKGSYSGFTLVELSIVLVIIGLIVGGVLVGRDLVRSSEIKSVLSDQVRYNTAARTFQTKYNELPGDMLNATNYWGIPAWGCGSPTLARHGSDGSGGFGTGTQTCNGDGDGQICGSNTVFWTIGMCYEAQTFWQHLANAGLIPGSYIGGIVNSGTYAGSNFVLGQNIPPSRISNAGFSVAWLCLDPSNSTGWFVNGFCGNVILFGAQKLAAPGSNYTDWAAYPTLSPSEAQNLDTKVDDGKPGTGKVMTTTGGIYTPSCTTTNNPATAAYNISVGGPQCNLIFQAGF